MRVLMGFALLITAAGGAVMDRVAVTVDSYAITQSEVLEEIRVTSLLNGEPLDLSPATRRAAAERLVDQHLIRQEMDVSSFPQPAPAEAEQVLLDFGKSHSRNDAEFRQALERYGITRDELKAHLLWQLAAMRFTEVRFEASAPRTIGLPLRANRARTPPPGVDGQMESWLKEARGQARIEFKKEAFE